MCYNYIQVISLPILNKRIKMRADFNFFFNGKLKKKIYFKMGSLVEI